MCPRHVSWHCLHHCDTKTRVALLTTPLAHPSLLRLGCITQYSPVESVVDVESDTRGAITLSDPRDEDWEALFVPSSSSHRDPNRAPTEMAPSTQPHWLKRHLQFRKPQGLSQKKARTPSWACGGDCYSYRSLRWLYSNSSAHSGSSGRNWSGNLSPISIGSWCPRSKLRS